MELKEVLEKIKERFLRAELDELVVKLDEVPRGAATGGEGMALIGEFLLRLNQTDPYAFDKIRDLIDEYVKLCESYGLKLRLQ